MFYWTYVEQNAVVVFQLSISNQRHLVCVGPLMCVWRRVRKKGQVLLLTWPSFLLTFSQEGWSAEESSPRCPTTTSSPSSLCPRRRLVSMEVGPASKAHRVIIQLWWFYHSSAIIMWQQERFHHDEPTDNYHCYRDNYPFGLSVLLQVSCSNLSSIIAGRTGGSLVLKVRESSESPPLCLKLIKDQVRSWFFQNKKVKVSYSESYSHYKCHRASLVLGLRLCLSQVRYPHPESRSQLKVILSLNHS